MSDFITCAYSIHVVGSRSVASFAVDMAAVPVDLSAANIYGLLLVADATTIDSQTVTRTMQFRMTPATNAALHCILIPGDGSGSPVDDLIIDNPGALYAGIPVLSFTPQAGQPAPTRKAIAKCLMGVGGAVVLAGGSGYTSPPTIALAGGNLVPGGVQGTVHATLSGDAVNGIIVDTLGGPYNAPPIALLSGGGGSGAVLSIGLEVVNTKLIDSGVGYTVAPVISVTPPFASFFKPSVADPRTAMAGFMTQAFQKALQSSIDTAVPVIS